MPSPLASGSRILECMFLISRRRAVEETGLGGGWGSLAMFTVGKI